MNTSQLQNTRRSRKSVAGDSESHREKSTIYLHPARIVLLSFLSVILLGTFLLASPRATNGSSLSVVDALFTATSATCVTGLAVADTGTKFTTFGQIVILVLIQIGGLGIMTLSTFFIYIFARKLSLTEREIVQDTFSQNPMADLGRLLKLVFGMTIIIEAIGALLLFFRFIHDHSLQRALYLGAFHSISAFCNAGFALFPDSFEAYRGDIYTNIVLSGLIILGGLGFVVVFDLLRARRNLNRFMWRKLMFHTRVVLVVTLGLLLAGWAGIFILEYNHSPAGKSLGERLIASWFQSVTTRTAGFNTLDFSELSSATLFLITILMFIGASPGSCGGGIKTSTFMVIMGSVFARVKMQERVNVFYRRIPEATVSRAISVVFFSTLIVVGFTFLILLSEGRANVSFEKVHFIDYFFEVVSAFGTVGLTSGLTPTLSSLGKILIVLLMFIGRLGPLTLTLAMQGRKSAPRYKYVQENVLVG